jgi:hypothetical protein
VRYEGGQMMFQTDDLDFVDDIQGFVCIKEWQGVPVPKGGTPRYQALAMPSDCVGTDVAARAHARYTTKQDAADLTKRGTQLGGTVADVTRKTTVWYFVLAPLTLLYLAVVFKIATSMRPISGLLGLPTNHLYAIGADIGVFLHHLSRPFLYT